MKLKIKRLRDDAKLPSYAHEGDAGLDVYSCEELVIPSGERRLIKTGISMAFDKGCVALVWDRSGLAVKHGMKTMAGVIDSGYRGEVGIVLLNTTSEDFKIHKHDRIAQILLQPVMRVETEEVTSLDETSRNVGGFGSTGK